MFLLAVGTFVGTNAVRPKSTNKCSPIPFRSAKPFDRQRKLSDGGGLHLLIAPNGGRYWQYSYRYKGKQKTLALGVYPDVGLAKARTRQARQLLVDGIDPAAEKQTAGKAFETVAREWHAHWMANRHQRQKLYPTSIPYVRGAPQKSSVPITEVARTTFCL
jgi:hypothetical protein